MIAPQIGADNEVPYTSLSALLVEYSTVRRLCTYTNAAILSLRTNDVKVANGRNVRISTATKLVYTHVSAIKPE